MAERERIERVQLDVFTNDQGLRSARVSFVVGEDTFETPGVAGYELQKDAAIRLAGGKASLLIIDQDAIREIVSRKRAEKAIFTRALRRWKSPETEAEGAREMEKAIDSAKFRGVALVLRVSDKAVDNTRGRRRPIFKRAVAEFGKKRGDRISFRIPSDKKLELVMLNEHRKSYILIKSGKGVFGTFSNNQVVYLGPK
jgi:hypothetical protein